MKKTLFIITSILMFVNISGCGETTYKHNIVGSNASTSFKEWGDVKIISDYKIGKQQIRVVRHKDNSCQNGYTDRIELNGEINKDSSLILERTLKGINPCKVKVAGKPDVTYVTTVYMNSNGGYVKDGIKIGRIFKKYGVNAIITHGQQCSSSCAFAFLGAKFRSMRGNSSKLLFHSPYDNSILGMDCYDRVSAKHLADYYKEMIGETNGSVLYDRTMDYCSKSNGWTINSDAAKIFGITNF